MIFEAACFRGSSALRCPGHGASTHSCDLRWAPTGVRYKYSIAWPEGLRTVVMCDACARRAGIAGGLLGEEDTWDEDAKTDKVIRKPAGSGATTRRKKAAGGRKRKAKPKTTRAKKK